MLTIAVIVPHYLMGIAGGSGAMGLYMLVGGFFQAKNELPNFVWKYPLHYISLQTYAFTGLINNEFGDTGDVWQCPCIPGSLGSNSSSACSDTCTVTGEDVIRSFSVEVRNKWTDVGILAGMFVLYRILFLILLSIKERRQKSR